MEIQKLKYALLGLVFSTNLIAQDFPVLHVKPETQLKGLLLDPLGNPIIGAKVAVKGGSKRLAVSNLDGEFLILLHRETDSILSISSVGYQPKDVPVSVQQTG